MGAMENLVNCRLELGGPGRSSRELFDKFRAVLSYEVEDGKPINAKVLDERLWGASGVVYARVHRGEIVYVGKADGQLGKRMKDHLRRIPLYSKEKDIKFREWAEGKTITIYAHQPKPVKVLGLVVSAHAGLERALIDEFKPRFVARR